MARPPDDSSIVDSTAALASLYQAPLAEFVARRSALVSQLKRSGHKDVATRIAAAGKPSRSAFMVNQVHWRARAAYDAVLEAGTAARAAQQARLLGSVGSDLADTMNARDAAVRAAVIRAEQLAAAEGPPVSDAIRAQVRASFDALAAHGLEGRVPHGYLTADVELPGLAALAGLVLPTAPSPPARKFEVVARRADPAPPDDPPAPPPDPQIVALEGRLAQLQVREEEAGQRISDLDRSLAAATEVLAAAEAAAAEAARKVESARHALTKGDQAREAARTEKARLADERNRAARQLEELRGAGGALAPTEDRASAGRPRRSEAKKKAPTGARPAPVPRPPRG